MKTPPRNNRLGFTLIELSLVLVIIGLVIGGIIVGNQLIEVTTTNKFISQIGDYTTKVRLYKDKFGYLPGDDPNALNYFPECIDNTNYCNGSGNGKIIDEEVFLGTFETIKIWEHLSLAGFLNNDAPLSHNHSNNSLPDSINSPKLNLPGAYITAMHSEVFPLWVTVMKLGNHFLIGNSNKHGIVRPLRSMSIDLKLDDGIAYTGKVISGDTGDGDPSHANCQVGWDQFTPMSDYDISYQEDIHGCKMTLQFD